jgi:GGDEF domain-containing protein
MSAPIPEIHLHPYERIALAVHEALPGQAGDRLLARIVDELASVPEDDDGGDYSSTQLELERQLATDPVTGLPNRVRFMDDLTRAIAAATRYDEPLSVLVVDTAGPESDHRAVGEALLQLVRITDVVARVAADRFAIILSRTGVVGCALVAARVRAVANHSITLGAATLEGHESIDAPALLARAEQGLSSA